MKLEGTHVSYCNQKRKETEQMNRLDALKPVIKEFFGFDSSIQVNK